MANIFQSLFGSAPQLQQLERFRPQQQQLQNQAINAFNPLLKNVLQPTNTSAITNEVQRKYDTEMLPSLAERFSALGQSPGHSSAFGGALAGSQANLASQLASLESQYAFQDKGRQQQLLGLLANLGMQPSFEYYKEPGQAGLFGNAGTPAFQSLFGDKTNPIEQLSSLLPFGQFLPLLLNLFGNAGPQAQIGIQQQ